MNKDETFSKCRKLYKDILNGYSYVKYHKVYIKHFKETDIGEISEIKQNLSYEAREKGLLSEEEKVQLLIDNDLWSVEKEQEIQSLSEQVSNHQQAKTKLFLKAQLASVQRQIDSKTEKLQAILNEKISIVGLTSEKFSDKKSSEQVIRLALFKDEQLKVPLYSEEEYDELDPEESEKYLSIYSEIMGDFSDKTIKMISAASFFMNSLMLCKSNPFIFFGKSVSELTNFQSEIFSNGLSYKSVLEKGNSPDIEYHTDLEKMIEWYESSGNIQKVQEKAKDRQGSTMMGASKEELRMMSRGEATVDLEKFAEQKGGTLNMEDFISIHSED
jgi:hypothetical protein